MICIYFLYLTFIFSDGFKNHLTWPWWSMRKQSEQIVLIFYLPFSLSWHCFKYETIQRNDYFDIIFLFQKCNVILSVTKAAKSNPRAQSEMQPNRKCFWYLVKVKISVRTQSGQSQSITLYNLKKVKLKLVFPKARQMNLLIFRSKYIILGEDVELWFSV